MSVPVYSDVAELKKVCCSYFDNKDDAEEFIEMYDFGGVYRILEIFTYDKPFRGDFKSGLFSCRNDEIYWHLEAISNAFSERKILVGRHYTVKYSVPFDYRPGQYGQDGQGKLFYSLLYFCLHVAKKGFKSIVEVGGGPLSGGTHHESVCTIMNSVDAPVEMLLYDPLQQGSSKNIGPSVITGIKQAIVAGDVFADPVFSDIYADHGYKDIQDSIEAPLIMKKLINGHESNIVSQPFHNEKRGLQGNEQLINLCRFHPNQTFDGCADCLKMGALSLEFGIPYTALYDQLVYLGVNTCSAGHRKGHIDRLYTAINNVKPSMLMKTFNESSSVVFSLTPDEKIYRDFLLSFENVHEFTRGRTICSNQGYASINFFDVDVKPHYHLPFIIKCLKSKRMQYINKAFKNKYILCSEVAGADHVMMYFDEEEPVVHSPIIDVGIDSVYNRLEACGAINCEKDQFNGVCAGRQCGTGAPFVYLYSRYGKSVTLRVHLNRSYQTPLNMHERLKNIDSVGYKSIESCFADDIIEAGLFPRSAEHCLMFLMTSPFDYKGYLTDGFLYLKYDKGLLYYGHDPDNFVLITPTEFMYQVLAADNLLDYICTYMKFPALQRTFNMLLSTIFGDNANYASKIFASLGVVIDERRDPDLDDDVQGYTEGQELIVRMPDSHSKQFKRYGLID
jgi:hypothetical protein